jgi:hypothetical protein
MSAGGPRRKKTPQGRDAHGNAVPLSVTRVNSAEQADPHNLAQRRGKPGAGTMAKAPGSSEKNE